MKINANELRQGNVLETETGLWAILKANHVSPGKGGAFVQVEMRNLRTGIKRDDKFRSGEQVERVRIDDEDFTFLFGDDTILTFMNPETYEQVAVHPDVLGDDKVLLADGMKCYLRTHEGVAISIEFPQKIVVEIAETEPVTKGQTASSSYKPAVCTNGLRVLVPPHIGAGTRIVINTDDYSYQGREKD
jgi:elongation factor P